MKTAVAVLQELMVKLKKVPEYECIAQSGPPHLAMFEYRCMAEGITVTAVARSKKEAKQEVAKLMLQRLDEQGLAVPPPFGCGLPSGSPSGNMLPPGSASGNAGRPGAAAAAATAPRSFVPLLQELCVEYKLPSVEYELISDTGPPHARLFTISAKLGLHERQATATTKKAARQLAAEQLYTYLRENLARVTEDFVEDEALQRAHEKVMSRYNETREPSKRRPDLGQKIADYHLGLLTNVDVEKRLAALKILEETRSQSPERTLTTVAETLGLTVEADLLPADGGALTVLSLSPTAPALAVADRDARRAAAFGLRYLARMLDQ